MAGVAGGIADQLGIPDLYVRAAFLVLALVWGLGVFLYLVLWALTLDKSDQREPAPAADGERRAAYVLMFVGSLLLPPQPRDLEWRCLGMAGPGPELRHRLPDGPG